MSLKSLYLLTVAALLGTAACSSATSSTDSATAFDSAPTATATAPTPANLAGDAALALMRDAYTHGDKASPMFQRVESSALAPKLGSRFDRARQSLEGFSFAHADQGDTDSRVFYVLTAPHATTFAGFMVWAGATDDSDRHSADAVAFYAADGSLLDVESTSSGISDSEDAGDWSHVDRTKIAAEEATLRGAFSFDAKAGVVHLDPAKTQRADLKALPFASLVQRLQAELEASAFAHSDNGDDATRFVSVADASGKVAGYILTSDGSDDADEWSAVGYALFTAEGQLLAREISSAGFADTMDDDSVLIPAKR
jgi:hypothetical protein